jgi:hypothetical protein
MVLGALKYDKVSWPKAGPKGMELILWPLSPRFLIQKFNCRFSMGSVKSLKSVVALEAKVVKAALGS